MNKIKYYDLSYIKSVDTYLLVEACSALKNLSPIFVIIIFLNCSETSWDNYG